MKPERLAIEISEIAFNKEIQHRQTDVLRKSLHKLRGVECSIRVCLNTHVSNAFVSKSKNGEIFDRIMFDSKKINDEYILRIGMLTSLIFIMSNSQKTLTIYDNSKRKIEQDPKN
jgi:hypothetical protein